MKRERSASEAEDRIVDAKAKPVKLQKIQICRTIQRAYPWCLLPDWAWYCQGAFIFAFISVPLVSAIFTTIPELKVCKAVYYKTRLGRSMTDWIVSMKNSLSSSIARRIMRDPRNFDYLPWMLACSFLPPLLMCWVLYRHLTYGFELSTLLIYHHFRAGPRFRLFAHHHVLIHKEGHDYKGIFRGCFRTLNQLCGMWAGLFYGSIPFHYGTAHTKVHHRWHNDVDDVHTNIDLDRTIFSSYMIYLPRFFFYWSGISPLIMFLKRKEYRYARDLAMGMIYYYGVGALLCFYVDWTFCCAYFLYPFLESLTILGMIAYIWHAFVDPSDPTNQYVNSVTILNGGDNIWNEDYHVVHHHAPHIHWTQAPAHFEQEKEKYAAVKATIFKDCEEGLMIYWMFSGLWDDLAEHFVDLTGELSHEQKKALLLERLQYQADPTTDDMWASWGSRKQRNWDHGKTD